MPPKPFEHTVETDTDLGRLLATLDALSALGWELVGAIQVLRRGDHNHYFATLRKQI